MGSPFSYQENDRRKTVFESKKDRQETVFKLQFHDDLSRKIVEYIGDIVVDDVF